MYEQQQVELLEILLVHDIQSCVVEVLLDIHYKHVIYDLQQFEQQVLRMETTSNGETTMHLLQLDRQHLLQQMQQDIDHEIIIVLPVLYFEVILIDLIGQRFKMIIFGEIQQILQQQDNDHVQMVIMYHHNQNGLEQ